MVADGLPGSQPFKSNLARLDMKHSAAARLPALGRFATCEPGPLATGVLGAIQSERHRAGCVFAGERDFRGGSGCGGVACAGTVSVSDTGRPSP
jgi:hypothetical protein